MFWSGTFISIKPIRVNDLKVFTCMRLRILIGFFNDRTQEIN